MDERERQIRVRMRDDFPYYADKNLKIRPKKGGTKVFELNKAQLYIHERVEQQRRETGRVRAIILKGRQQGCSTYVEGRMYWRVSHRKGIRAFILTHEDEATKNLFDMVERYHEFSNPLLKPSTGAANGKELIFDKLDSGYKVGTAGNKGVGRSSTIQLFHGSEVAFWPHASEHAKGILQAIPDEEDTEVFLESTANGVGNFYHQQWKAAESGRSGYMAIFVPWYWQDEYVKKAPADFHRSAYEEKLQEMFGLSEGQLVWRRSKIIELSAGGADGDASFKQEYPMTASEAFQMTGEAGLISPKVVMRARKATVRPSHTLVVGVDPSRGGDKFALIRRRGRKAYGYEYYVDSAVDKLGKQVAICKKVLDGERPTMMFIDAGGGDALVDRLHELGYTNVRAVAFGSSPLNAELYKNKRAEMWGEMAEWLNDDNLPVDIPDDDELQSELCASPYKRDSHDRIQMEAKEKIKSEYGFSPDGGDALGLTFSQSVIEYNQNDLMPEYYGDS
jgi:hypothetical protein